MDTHSPQDHIYGPLEIPSYCWPIIDTEEFQRLRYLAQLGTVCYVYPGANHTRFEHSLGCCHLAVIFMEHFQKIQPELKITKTQIQAVVLAALCHNLGHAPFSQVFDTFAKEINPGWYNKNMSCKLLKYIVKEHKINIPDNVVDAACSFILGEAHKDFPEWQSQLVNNKCDIDVNKFDFLARDLIRTVNIGKFEYDRLIFHCRVIDGKLAWRISEVPTIERLFYNRNDMHMRVYQHRVSQSVGCMIRDIFQILDSKLHFEELMEEPSLFWKFDDRFLYRVERGDYGKDAQDLAHRITIRDIYKCVGELRVKPDNTEGERYSQQCPSSIEDDISMNGGFSADNLRVVSMRFRYGLSRDQHPLLSVPFWKPGNDKIIYLSTEEISCICPAHFQESAIRVFVTEKSQIEEAQKAFDKWKVTSIFE